MQPRHFSLGMVVLLLHTAFPAAQALGQPTNLSDPGADPVQADASARPLTLAQAIELALATNPALRSATRSIGIADGAVQQAGSHPNPALSLLMEGTGRDTRTETAQISQLIELGGKRAARIAVAEEERKLVLDDVNVKRADLRADVIAVYMEALTAQERVALAQASVDLARRATEVTSRRVKAGKLSPVELTRSNIAAAAAALELTQANADLAVARRRLASLWASTRPLDRPLQAPDAALARLPAWEALERRLDGAPQLRRARSAIAGREAQLALQRAQRIPDLTLTLGSKREPDSGRSQAVVGLSVPLPLFDRNQGNLLSALRRADQARDDFEAERLRMGQALLDAYQRASAAATQTTTLHDQVLPAARSAYDAAVTGFELGKFGFTDVLDAQRTLFQARTQYLRALADQYRSIADIQRYVPETLQ